MRMYTNEPRTYPAIRHGQPGIAEVIALHVQLPRYTMTSTHHHFRPQHDAHMRGMASSSTSAAASSQAAPPASAISVTKDPALSSPSSSSREVLGRITAQTEGMNTGTGTDTSTAHVPAPATRASHTPHTPHAPHAPHASHAPSMSVPSQHYIPVDTEYR